MSHPRTLADWTARAAACPASLDAGALEEAGRRGGAGLFALRPDAATLARVWYAGHVGDPQAGRCSLPLALPYLLDLGALLLARPGRPIAPWRRPPGIDDDLAAAYQREYVERHLRALGRHGAIDRLRDRLVGCADPEVLRGVVVRLAELLFHRLADAWRRRDDPPWDGRPRWLGDPADQVAFLIDLARVAEATNVLGSRPAQVEALFPATERFKLATAPRRPDVLGLDALRLDLFRLCLATRPLDDVEPWPEPTRDGAGAARGTPRGVARSRRLEDLPDALPQELALLRHSDAGARLLVHKTAEEGVLVWERQAVAEPEPSRRWLLFFLVAGDAATERPDGPVGFTATGHALRLVFAALGDLPRHATDPRLCGRVVVYLARERRQRRGQVWTFELGDLRARLTGEALGDMLAVEDLAPGFFFREPRGAAPPPAAVGVVFRDALDAVGPDRVTTIRLAPAERLEGLPELSDRHRNWAVRVGVRPGRVEMTPDRHGPFEALDEREARRRWLEDVLGLGRDRR